jgi:ADP-L-glycero-D-manno-heptose 6-epimerase
MIVVTGGAGFIGSALVWKLNKMGMDKIIIVDELGNEDKWKNLNGLNYSDFFNKNNSYRSMLLYNRERRRFSDG